MCLLVSTKPPIPLLAVQLLRCLLLGVVCLHYPDTARFKQTVKVGVVRYRGCVTVNIGTEGLFLWVRPPLGRQGKFLIPWGEIKRVKKGRLYGLQGVCLSIGDPEVGEITVYQGLFDQIKAHLK